MTQFSKIMCYIAAVSCAIEAAKHACAAYTIHKETSARKDILQFIAFNERLLFNLNFFPEGFQQTIDIGDKTGNYSGAIKHVDTILARLIPLTDSCDIIDAPKLFQNQPEDKAVVVIQSHRLICDCINARISSMLALKKALKKEVTYNAWKKMQDTYGREIAKLNSFNDSLNMIFKNRR